MDGDRGGNIAYCGYLFTEPETQPDGSLRFYQIVLTCEDESFHGWDITEPVTPDTATLRPVHLVPTEGGWRVDEEPNEFGDSQQAARYTLLREQFGYHEEDFSYYWNDRLCIRPY